MNILQISPQIPYPLTDGGKIGIFNITKYLALRGHSITMLAISTDRQPGDLSEVQRYCRLEIVYKNTRHSAISAIGNLFSSVPYNIAKRHSRDVERKLVELLTAQRFDVVHVDHLHMAHYGQLAKERYGIPIVLREHNVEMTLMKRFAQEQRNLFLKWYAQMQYQRLYKYEPVVCALFDKCLVITPEDEERIRSLNPTINTAVVPAGVDVSYFSPRHDIQKEKYSILWMGSLDWLPNADSFWWFYKQIFPHVIARCPNAKLYVVGKNPPVDVRHLRADNVIVIGFVEDVREYIARCQVSIVPLRIGGGMRIKIIETLAMEQAIVSTSTGCEGIAVTNGENILIADDEEKFAHSILELFEEEALRKKIGKSGCELVQRVYRWEEIAKRLEEEYTLVLNSKSK
jgi:glycosyltransferase involved in cell wall biosynthesis